MAETLKTIDESRSLHVKLEDQIVPDSESNQESNEGLYITPKDVDHQELWEEIKDLKQERSSFEMKEAPVTEVGSSIAKTSEQNQTKLNEGDMEGEMVSISRTLATLPSDLGHQEFNSKIVP